MRVDSRHYPLRKITGHRNGLDVLECGHDLRSASDMFGQRFPDKRRCRLCWAAMSEAKKKAILDKKEAAKKKKKDAEWKAWRKYSERNQERNS